MKNEEAINIKKEIARLQKRADKLLGEISNKRDKMKKVCVHNESEMKYNYEPGGYLDRSKYINSLTCKVCGKVIDEKVTIGGFE